MAGLTITGTPASTAGASFSSIPQTGKLKALMNTPHPAGRVDVLADEGPAPAERLGLAVDVEDVAGQLPPSLAGVHEQALDAPVDVDHGVADGGPGPGRLLVQAVAVLP